MLRPGVTGAALVLWTSDAVRRLGCAGISPGAVMRWAGHLIGVRQNHGREPCIFKDCEAGHAGAMGIIRESFSAWGLARHRYRLLCACNCRVSTRRGVQSVHGRAEFRHRSPRMHDAAAIPGPQRSRSYRALFEARPSVARGGGAGRDCRGLHAHSQPRRRT